MFMRLLNVVLTILLLTYGVGPKVVSATVKEKICKLDCEEFCQLQGQPSGYCFEGHCHCRPGANSRKLAAVAPGGCRFNCRQVCQLRGERDGRCENGRCICKEDRREIVLKMAEEDHEILDPSQLPCRYDCNDVCQFRGETSGQCEKGRCICKARKDSSNGTQWHMASRKSQKIHVLKKSCVNDCSVVCQKLGKALGRCISGICSCEPSESRSALAISNQVLIYE